MGKTGRLCSPEFKEKAIRLVHSSDESYPVAKVARDLDVSAVTLRKWVKQAHIDAGEREGLTTEEKEELRRLELPGFGLDPGWWTHHSFGCECRLRRSTKCQERQQATRQSSNVKPFALLRTRETARY